MTTTDLAGHRARLRARFAATPSGLSEAELLELLLTYAIPRQDVAPLAEMLLERFGGLDRVLTAPLMQLTATPGLGETSALLLKVVARMHMVVAEQSLARVPDDSQPTLFEIQSEPGPLFSALPEPEEVEMRTYANDEVVNALTFIPQAARFATYADFKEHLRQRLPYNAESTRQRRANYILERFFPGERLDTPLAYYAARCTAEDLKPVLFYHICRAEPLAAAVAEELVWPALPRGYVEREEMREFILRHLPDLASSSQKKVLQSLYYTYSLLEIGISDDTTLRFQIRSSTLPAFLYLLTAEFPQPGIYTFEALEQGPLHRWLLWDRGWMRRQLYNLRDAGIVAKVSEIDTVRQFTLAYAIPDALRYFFEELDRDALVLRDQAANGYGAGGLT
ncbi:MAG TPA: DUF1819 family protein [Anaerolineae bacterium]|nr:DUF1819 family protein [Anaerolineae bacterium]